MPEPKPITGGYTPESLQIVNDTRQANEEREAREIAKGFAKFYRRKQRATLIKTRESELAPHFPDMDEFSPENQDK